MEVKNYTPFYITYSHKILTVLRYFVYYATDNFYSIM